MRRAVLVAVVLIAAYGVFRGVQTVRVARETRSPIGRYRAGVDALYKGRYRSAIAALTEVILAEPRNARAYYFRGLAQRELRSLPAAVDDLTRALQLDPTLAGAAYERALARESLGDITAALSDIDSLLKADPKRLELRAVRARFLEALGRDREAEEELDRLIKERPKSYFPLIDRAALRRRRKDHKEALADYDAAIALNAGIAPAYIGKAGTLAQIEGQERQAIDTYSTAVKSLPTRADLYFAREHLYKDLHDSADELTNITAAIGIDPQIAAYWVERGIVYYRRAISEGHQEEYPLAALDLTKAIELSPKTSTAYFYRSAVSTGMEKFDDAIVDAKKVLELDEKNADGYNLLCGIYISKNQFDTALPFCDKGIDLDPYYANLRAKRADVLLAQNRFREALVESSKAIDIQPSEDYDWQNRARIELVAGMREKAAADCRRGLALNPNNFHLQAILKDATSGGNF